MTYNVFGGTLSLTLSVYTQEKKNAVLHIFYSSVLRNIKMFETCQDLTVIFGSEQEVDIETAGGCLRI